MDEYKDYLYASRPYMRAPSFNIGDVSRQVLLRREKKCQSFGWYLNEVAYDLTSNYPLPPKLVVTGEVRDIGLMLNIHFGIVYPAVKKSKF